MMESSNLVDPVRVHLPVPVKSFRIVMIEKVHFGAGGSYVRMKPQEFEKSSSASFLHSDNQCSRKTSVGHQILLPKNLVSRYSLSGVVLKTPTII